MSKMPDWDNDSALIGCIRILIIGVGGFIAFGLGFGVVMGAIEVFHWIFG